MCSNGDLPLERQLGPAELPDSSDIPCPFLDGQVCLQDDHVLGPAYGHSLGQQLWSALIGAVEFPHPAQVPGRKARDVRIGVVQIRRSGDCRPFLGPAVDHPAYLTVQLHLRKTGGHQRIQRRKHGAVVYGFSDVHGPPPFWRCAPVDENIVGTALFENLQRPL